MLLSSEPDCLLKLLSTGRCILFSKYLVDFFGCVLNRTVAVLGIKQLSDELLECLPLVALESELVLGLDERPVDALQDPLHYRLLLSLLLLGELAQRGGVCGGGILLGLECVHEAVQVRLCKVDLSLSRLLVLASRIELKHQYQALGGTLHNDLLRFTRCSSIIEELDTHVEAG